MVAGIFVVGWLTQMERERICSYVTFCLHAIIACTRPCESGYRPLCMPEQEFPTWGNFNLISSFLLLAGWIVVEKLVAHAIGGRRQQQWQPPQESLMDRQSKKEEKKSGNGAISYCPIRQKEEGRPAPSWYIIMAAACPLYDGGGYSGSQNRHRKREEWGDWR